MDNDLGTLLLGLFFLALAAALIALYLLPYRFCGACGTPCAKGAAFFVKCGERM